MIRTLIVDDEPAASENLNRLIQLYCPDLNVVTTANSVESALKKMEEVCPELVFLDVHLAQETSFSILEQLPDISFAIIFVSAHSNYAFNAFKVNAIDYLLKPFDSDDLILAVEKYKNLKSLKETQQLQDITIRVHHNDTVLFIPASSIAILTAHDNYTIIHSKNNQKYTASKTLKEFEEMLAADNQFIRIHRSHIINLQCVLTYSKMQPYTVTLINGKEFEISRRKRSEVIAMLNERITV